MQLETFFGKQLAQAASADLAAGQGTVKVLAGAAGVRGASVQAQQSTQDHRRLRVFRFGGRYARVSEQVGRLLAARARAARLHQPCRDSLGRGLRLHGLLPGRSG